MILYRYFAREVLSTMVAVAGIVLVISMGWRFNGYLNEAAQGVLSSDILFLLMAFRLPGFLELIIPISFFMSLMLAYGRLYVDSEMTVLESCGMGPEKIIRITLFLALIVMLVTAMITFWLKPAGEIEVENIITGQQNQTEFHTLAPGRFQATQSGARVTYTEEISSDGILENVFMNESNVANVNGLNDVTTIIATSGNTRVDELGNRFLVLKDGKQYSGVPGARNYQVIEYEEYGQMIGKEQGHKTKRRLFAVPTMELLASEDIAYRSELHWRISVVLMIPVMALIAVPLSRANPRQGRFNRLLPGMLLCFLYFASLSGAKTGIQREDLLPETIWMIHGVFFSIMLLIYRLPVLQRLLRGS